MSEAEYLHFILTKSGLVDDDTFSQLREKFQVSNTDINTDITFILFIFIFYSLSLYGPCILQQMCI